MPLTLQFLVPSAFDAANVVKAIVAALVPVPASRYTVKYQYY